MYWRIFFILLLIFSTHQYDVMAENEVSINNYVFTSEDIFTDNTKAYLNKTSNSIFEEKKILVFFVSYKNNCHLHKVAKVKNKDEFSVPNLRKEMLCLYDFTAKIRSKLLANLPNYIDRSIVILFPPDPSDILYMINFGDNWDKEYYTKQYVKNDDFERYVRSCYLQKDKDQFIRGTAKEIYKLIHNIDTYYLEKFILKNNSTEKYAKPTTEIKKLKEIEEIASLHFIWSHLKSNKDYSLRDFVRFQLDHFKKRRTLEDGNCDTSNTINNKQPTLNFAELLATFSFSLALMLGALYLAIAAFKRRTYRSCAAYSLAAFLLHYPTICLWYAVPLLLFSCP
jgi:hypothetical protein